MSTFITKLEAAGTGPRLAVKDVIDVAGVPTTAGSRAVAQTAAPATADAACLAGARAAGARIVGKTNLHELAMLPLGMADLFRPGLVDARRQLAAWRQSLLGLFGQVELLALPTLLVFPPRLDDLTPDSLVNVITEITQYTGGCRMTRDLGLSRLRRGLACQPGRIGADLGKCGYGVQLRWWR